MDYIDESAMQSLDTWPVNQVPDFNPQTWEFPNSWLSVTDGHLQLERSDCPWLLPAVLPADFPLLVQLAVDAAATGAPWVEQPFWDIQTISLDGGLALVRGILNEYGISVSVDTILEELREALAEKGIGLEFGHMSLAGIGQLLEFHGIHTETVLTGTFEELMADVAQGRTVIVPVDMLEVWRPFGEWLPDAPNHVVTVVGIDDSNPENPQIRILDPEDGEIRLVPRSIFIDAWGDSHFSYIRIPEVPPDLPGEEIWWESRLGTQSPEGMPYEHPWLFPEDVPPGELLQMVREAHAAEPAGTWMDTRFWERQILDYNCGVAIQKVILEAYGYHISQEVLNELAVERGWLTEDGMPLVYIGRLLQEYGIDTHTEIDATVADLIVELQAGHKVIVPVDASELWDNPWFEELWDWLEEFLGIGADHVIWITEIDMSDHDNPTVTVNDTGQLDGAGRVYSLNDFIDAWADAHFSYIATSEPPPNFSSPSDAPISSDVEDAVSDEEFRRV